MPLRCTGETRSPTQTDDDSDDDDDDVSSNEMSFWQEAPDSILLHIFRCIDIQGLGLICQTCKNWKRISLDESLWKSLLQDYLGIRVASLPPEKESWRMEVKRFLNHRPVVLTETLHDHRDEVLHVSFSHDGKLFSTTSKDASLKIWTLGNPTTLRYTKDFRELLGWDFTQYSCFNESDTMVLVSSVKTTAYMDRRGYMAVLSLVHDFEILKIVTMDPSQLFGAWLDDTTFLGGNLEISLDRFATTVQIEAYDVPETFSPLPHPPCPVVEESLGQTLFTFSSETASLIKFLTVAFIKQSPTTDIPEKPLIKDDMKRENTLLEMSPVPHTCVSSVNENQSSCGSNVDVISSVCVSEVDNSSEVLRVADDRVTCVGGVKGDVVKASSEGEKVLCADCEELQTLDSSETTSLRAKSICDKCNLQAPSKEGSWKIVGKAKRSDSKRNQMRMKKNETSSKGSNETSISACKRPKSLYSNSKESEMLPGSAGCSDDSLSSKNGNTLTCDDRKTIAMQQKNLIFVTGEFAVALHQLGFKNVPPYIKESVLSRGITPLEEDNPESFMVVNYSNNDVHFVRRQQEPDKPDSLLDLHGHVTGMCLTADQRYLFINCRPWIGQVDRRDPWATPDLSPNLEIRIIDLFTLKDLGIRYMGHKGFSSSNMCCFVFLDVGQDYVASGSEDSFGYLWDKHYGALVAKFEHERGVVNAVGFSPRNQEVLVTVSDDWTIKLWRSKQEAKLFFDNAV